MPRNLLGVKINLTIRYTADAEQGETAADEEAALDTLTPLVQRFGQQVVEAAQAEGLSVAVGE